MTERKVLQRHHVFVKREFNDNKQWTVDLGLSFQPDEMHVRSVAFSNQRERDVKTPTNVENAALRGPTNWMTTLYMENVGDLCTLTESVNHTTNYIFDVKSALSFGRFEIRNLAGELDNRILYYIDGPPVYQGARLVLHLEFIKYADPEHKH